MNRLAEQFAVAALAWLAIGGLVWCALQLSPRTMLAVGVGAIVGGAAIGIWFIAGEIIKDWRGKP